MAAEDPTAPVASGPSPHVFTGPARAFVEASVLAARRVTLIPKARFDPTLLGEVRSSAVPVYTWTADPGRSAIAAQLDSLVQKIAVDRTVA